MVAAAVARPRRRPTRARARAGAQRTDRGPAPAQPQLRLPRPSLPRMQQLTSAVVLFRVVVQRPLAQARDRAEVLALALVRVQVRAVAPQPAVGRPAGLVAAVLPSGAGSAVARDSPQLWRRRVVGSSA